MTDSLWYKDAVVYQSHVRAFFDSTNDGVGDFAGLTQKLSYLESLGVNCLWLLPFYPSPLRDDGYDIADYENIHPSYGSLQDFDRFIEEAHRRNIRVITELVINHTSDQHPWFQAARRAPAGSPERDFYVWSDTNQKYQGVRIIFTDTETSNWSWDDTAKAYYWHRFFHHQPDLNFDNPAVIDAVARVMYFWLDRGVDGLRLDAVPYLIEREATICENLEETHEVLKQIRARLDARYRDRMLLAEANQWPADVRPYFGDGDECHMAFHFPLMPRMFMALRQEDRHPITEILRQTPEIPENCQWGLFLRNHDELTLEMVTDEERDYMYQAYAADPQMRINVGIRRRLAPLMENSRPRIELMNSLLFSLPGTPVIYYGDELGMGDNIYLGDRNGVRTPMQWTGDRNGGFSRADPARLYAPPIMDPVYGFQAINVEAQERTPFSLLNWMKRMIALRSQLSVFGRGAIEFLPAHNRKVLVYVRQHRDDVLLCVANLSRTVQPVELDLSRFKGMTPVEMLGLTEFPRIGEFPYFLTLSPYAFYWFRLQQAPPALTARIAPSTSTDVPQAPGLLAGAAWDTLLEGNVRTLIERDLLLPFLQRQRWFGGKARASRSARFVDWGQLRRGPQPLFLTIVEVEYEQGDRDQYFLPLAVSAYADAKGIEERAPHAILATVTGARKGLLFDAWLDDRFARTLLEAFEREESIATRRGQVRAQPTSVFSRLWTPEPEPTRVSQMSGEQSNTSIVFGDWLILKLFRRLQPGINPDFEIGRHITEKIGFTRVPAVAGALEYRRPAEEPTIIGMLQQLVQSQADGWSHATDELGRFYDQVHGRRVPSEPLPRSISELVDSPIPRSARDVLSPYVDTAATLGRRTAEMHLALSSDASDAAFSPEPLAIDDVAVVIADATAQAHHALDVMKVAMPQLPADVAERANTLLNARETLIERIGAASNLRPTATRIRIHGDYHLGQVLWNEGDFYILDFEGEPARPIAQRRRKQSPLKDVAGMLRSFSYAAYAGLFAHTASRPAEFARLEGWARTWQSGAMAAFLHGYFDTAAGAQFIPADPHQRDALLQLFMLDKALYELTYELNNRPDWVRIPLWGIFELL
ncbi:MAG: maltose alpha-D-glucosyltransferase [Acidobacteria bacterium]|nr:maltose alpha-D-glucosyltransferase [Acidobacteriota bacterium]MCA1649071.1 maltose alpha-D-glucosyltransferase [Acidobacteriota bacterium]